MSAANLALTGTPHHDSVPRSQRPQGGIIITGPMPSITRQRTRPGLRMVEATNFPACLVVARSKHGGQVLAVVDQATPAPTLRRLARVLLRDEERRHLSRFLTDRKR